MKPKFKLLQQVKFNDGSDDYGTIIDTDIVEGNYYLIRRYYKQMNLKSLTHWYGEDELK